MFGAATAPAWACRVGGDQILFDELPAPIGLESAEVIFARFADKGDDFDRSNALHPQLDEVHPLVGFARLQGGHEQVPVYAMVSDCTHGFYGRPATSHDGDFYLVGRWILLPDGSKAFRAGGDWNGRWHY